MGFLQSPIGKREARYQSKTRYRRNDRERDDAVRLRAAEALLEGGLGPSQYGPGIASDPKIPR